MTKDDKPENEFRWNEGYTEDSFERNWNKLKKHEQMNEAFQWRRDSTSFMILFFVLALIFFWIGFTILTELPPITDAMKNDRYILAEYICNNQYSEDLIGVYHYRGGLETPIIVECETIQFKIGDDYERKNIRINR